MASYSKARKKRLRKVAPASELVDRVLTGCHVAEDLRHCRIFVEWRDLVGPRIAARTWPGRLDDGVLTVRVASSTWLHQLSFLQDELVQQINDALGEPIVVRELRLTFGRRTAADDVWVRPPSPPPPKRRPLPPPATGEKLSEIVREAACIDDPELRAVIIEARRKLNT